MRTENTDSQTRKKRFSRWENMMNSFRIKQTDQLQNKHILLVDDVVTTGQLWKLVRKNYWLLKE